MKMICAAKLPYTDGSKHGKTSYERPVSLAW